MPVPITLLQALPEISVRESINYLSVVKATNCAGTWALHSSFLLPLFHLGNEDHRVIIKKSSWSLSFHQHAWKHHHGSPEASPLPHPAQSPQGSRVLKPMRAGPASRHWANLLGCGWGVWYLLRPSSVLVSPVPPQLGTGS